MRLTCALLLTLVAAPAAARLERDMQHNMRYPEEGGDGSLSDPDQETNKDFAMGLMAMINEQFQRSSELLQELLNLDDTKDDVVSIISVKDPQEEDPVLERKRACLTALEWLHEQDEMQMEAQWLLNYFHLDSVSMFFWGKTSCDDLERPELVKQCNTVIEAKDVVKGFFEKGKTDEEVCDIMSTVSNLDDSNDLSCKLCERFVQMVDQALAQEVQQVQQVRAIIGDLCDAMSPDSMCHTFLKNFDDIVEWLKHGTDPLVICSRISMCSMESNSLIMDEADDDVFDVDDCFICTHVTDLIFQVNETFPEKLPILKNGLASVCSLTLPETECADLDVSFDLVVNLLALGQQPYELCTTTRFCSKDRSRDSALTRLDNDRSCVYCDAVTTVVEVILQESPDQIDLIREYADLICGILGDDSPCHEYVNQLDIVIDSLKKGIHPRNICTALKYCVAVSDKSNNPRVGMMRNGPSGMHQHVGIKGPEHHDNDIVMLQDTDKALSRPHGSCFFCTRVTMVIHYVNETSPEKLPIGKSILSNVCQLVPSKFKCDVVNQSFDKIVEMEKNGKYPHEICKSIGLCNALEVSEESQSDIVISEWPVGDAAKCTYCEFSTTVVKIALDQYGADVREVREYADMICDMLGQDNPCHVYVKEFDFVIDSITKGMSAKAICTELKFCPASENQLAISNTEVDVEPLVLPTHHSHDPGCAFCVHVALAIHYVNTTEPEKLPILKTILADVCKLATPDCKCDEVMKNFDKIVELENEKKRPSKICKAIGLCSKHVDVVVDDYSFADAVMDLVVDTRPVGSEGEEKTCFFCEYATMLMNTAYEQDSSKVEQIKDLSATVCALLGEDSGCSHYISMLDFVLDSLKNGADPQTICIAMTYCPVSKALTTSDPSDDDQLLTVLFVDMMEMLTESSVDGCFFCLQVASTIQVAVAEDPSKIQQIQQIAEVVCQMLPRDNQCHSVVKQLNTVVESLQRGEQPKTICHDIQCCSDDKTPVTIVPDVIATVNNDENGNTCAYCSGVVTVLKYALDLKSDQVQEMRQAAGAFCQLLPADDLCHNELKMFDEAVNELQAGKEPQEICQALKFCNGTEKAFSSLLSGALGLTGADFLPSRCTTCQQNTLLLASLITRPESLATFEREISSICRLIPNSSECELLMKHQDAIIYSLKKNEDVDTICTRIGECDSAVVEKSTEKTMTMGCLFCEYTSELLEHAKNSDKALREAKVALETICTILPPRVRCDALSSKFDELVSLMREGKSPSEACHSIALCDNDFAYSGSGDDPIVQSSKNGQESRSNIIAIQ